MPKAKIFLLSFERKFISKRSALSKNKKLGESDAKWLPNSCRGTGRRLIED